VALAGGLEGASAGKDFAMALGKMGWKIKRKRGKNKKI
jgi:hypothetical protein